MRQRAYGTPQCHPQRGPQSPRLGLVHLPRGAAGAESFNLPLGILSGRDRGCESVARSQGCVTPHPRPWLLGTALQLTPRTGGMQGNGEIDQQGKGFIPHAENRSKEGQVPQLSLAHLRLLWTSWPQHSRSCSKNREKCLNPPHAQAHASLSFEDNTIQLSWSQPINTQTSHRSAEGA